MDMISAIESKLKRKAKKNYLPMQLGDVPQTEADIRLLKELTSFSPSIEIEEGVNSFIDWYKEYY